MIVPYAVLLHMRYGVTPIFMGYVRICKTVHTVSPPPLCSSLLDTNLLLSASRKSSPPKHCMQTSTF